MDDKDTRSAAGVEIAADIKFGPDGLIPAVVQDAESGDVLMVAYTNREALARTIETGQAWFFSRSRQSLWHKGETSGNTMTVEAITADCDRDAVLIKVRPSGPACHTGAYTCFHNPLLPSPHTPGDQPGHFAGSSIIDEVYSVICERKANPTEASYTCRLLDSGIDRVLRKVGEEAGEFIIAAKNGPSEEVVWELADLWFHTMVAMAALDLPIDMVFGELERRRKPQNEGK